LNDKPLLRMAVWLQVRVRWRGLGLQLRLYMPSLSVTQSDDAAEVCGLWRYINVMPLPLHFCVY